MDQIANLIVSIKNATLVNKRELKIPHSKMKEAILSILKSEGFLSSYSVTEEDNKKYIDIVLATKPVSHIRIISKTGRRVYVKAKEIPKPLRGMGIVIVSTPVGVVTGRTAAKQGLGGELICEVW